MAPPSHPPPDRSLLVLVLDVSPPAWGERDLKRTAQDKARAAASKRSVGPARLADVLDAAVAFCLSVAALRRDNAVVVVGVADDEVAVLYPRKGGGGGGSGNSNTSLGSVIHDPPDTAGGKVDAGALNEGVRLGAAELVERASARAAARAEEADETAAATASSTRSSGGGRGGKGGAAIASALTVALCTINRFLVAAGGGVSALAPSDRGGAPGTQSSSAASDGGGDGGGGVLDLIAGGGPGSKSRRKRGAPSPRILVVQATDDRAGDYNAVMNCTFAAHRAGVVIDGCFVPSGIPGRAKQSAYLEQAADRTGGVFLAPSGAAQVGGALAEVLVSVFLSPVAVRRRMNLPALSEVDFRPRCFQTGETVDTAFVCNQCLSIFKDCPRESCPTCGADVVQKNRKKKASSPMKQSKKARHA